MTEQIINKNVQFVVPLTDPSAGPIVTGTQVDEKAEQKISVDEANSLLSQYSNVTDVESRKATLATSSAATFDRTNVPPVMRLDNETEGWNLNAEHANGTTTVFSIDRNGTFPTFEGDIQPLPVDTAHSRVTKELVENMALTKTDIETRSGATQQLLKEQPNLLIFQTPNGNSGALQLRGNGGYFENASNHTKLYSVQLFLFFTEGCGIQVNILKGSELQAAPQGSSQDHEFPSFLGTRTLEFTPNTRKHEEYSDVNEAGLKTCEFVFEVESGDGFYVLCYPNKPCAIGIDSGIHPNYNRDTRIVVSET